LNLGQLVSGFPFVLSNVTIILSNQNQRDILSLILTSCFEATGKRVFLQRKIEVLYK
jgi:hypothetical protein